MNDLMNSYKNFLLKNIQKHKVLINTIPHCGTHLVSSILETIGYRHSTYRKFGLIKTKVGLNWRLSEKISNFLPKNFDNSIHVSVASPKLVRFGIVKSSLNKVNFGEYALSHIPFDKKFKEYLLNHGWKCFFILRDPRDMCLSMLKHIESRPNHFGHMYLFNKLQSNSDRIEAIVKGFINEKNRKFIGINKMYSAMLSWSENSNFVFLKYEELVGKKGNGKILSQSNSIKKIFGNLNYKEKNLDTKFLQYVGNESYGKSTTFRKGKIGNWKEIFTEKDVMVFKKYTNKLLMSLGYEKNSKWGQSITKNANK